MSLLKKIFGKRKPLANPTDAFKRENQILLEENNIGEGDYISVKKYKISTGAFSIQKHDIPFKVDELLKINNSKVVKGEKLIKYRTASYDENSMINTVVHETAEIDGRVIYFKEEGSIVYEGQLVLAIKIEKITQEDLNQRYRNISVRSNSIVYEKENLTNKTYIFNSGKEEYVSLQKKTLGKKIIFSQYQKLKTENYAKTAELRIISLDNKIYFELKGFQKHFTYKEGAVFIIYVQSQNEVKELTYTFVSKPIREEKTHEGVIVSNKVEISKEDYKNILENPIVSWKLSYQENHEMEAKYLEKDKLIELQESIKKKLIVVYNETVTNTL